MNMEKSQRHEFPEKVKRTVAQRSAYLCSNPNCRILTIGPHSEVDKALLQGVAGHVCAAQKGGPRYDQSQTERERKGIKNAIWLCHNCSDTVDKDSKKYTKQVLLGWKIEHEKFILDGGGAPHLPEIELQTQTGLTLPNTGPAKITGHDIAKYREHVLCIKNTNDCILYNLDCRIQFPEPVVYDNIFESPAGSNIQCRPEIMQFKVFASGSGSVTTSGSNKAGSYTIDIDTLPPRRQLRIRFLSIESDELNGYGPIISDEALTHYILGKFQYQLHNRYFFRHFLVPLNFNKENRKIESSKCEDYDKSRRLIHRQVWL